MKPHPQSQELWKVLRNPKCSNCSLCEQAQTVCLLGDGPVPCDAMIIGEGPGFREDDLRIPFSGRSGVFMRDTLKEIGLDPSNIYITNVVACRPPGNRTPTNKEAKICSTLYLMPQIDRVKPKVILCLGNTAVQFALGRKSAVTKLEGTTFIYKAHTYLQKEDEHLKTRCVPSRHPSAVLRLEDVDQRAYQYACQQFKENLLLFKKVLNAEEEKEFPFEKNGSKFMKELTLTSLFPKRPPYLYVDIETNGLNPFREEAKIHCLSIVRPDWNQ